jgi:hypothetical protein
MYISHNLSLIPILICRDKKEYTKCVANTTSLRTNLTIVEK